MSLYSDIGTGVNKGFPLRPSRRFSAAKFTILMMISLREDATCGVMTIKGKILLITGIITLSELDSIVN